jgi:hypothetical protein
MLVGGLPGALAVDYPLRWRWSNPLPHGGNVVDMTYSAPFFLGVQVAERGQIFTSDDLSLWLPRDTQVTNSLRAVTFLGGRVIVTGENGLVLYANDGQTFLAGTLIDGPTTNWLEAVTASASLVTAVGDNGVVYTSTNGIFWKKQTSGVANWLRGVAHGNLTFVAVGEQGTILTSANGTNWFKRTSGTSIHLNRVSFFNSQFVAVGDAGLTLVSTNAGANWFPNPSGATNALQDAAAAGTATLLSGEHEVRLQQGGAWYNQLALSNGPPNWTYYCNLGRPDFFLIAGQSGMQSEGYQTNGLPSVWLSPYNSIRHWLWDLTYLPGLYVSVGDFGTILTSGNGVDWALELPPVSVTNSTFLGIGGSTNLLVAAGDAGSLIISPNNLVEIISTNSGGTVITQLVSTLGVVWQAITPRPTTNDIQGVANLGTNLYVVTGANGTVLTSANGTNWTSRTTPTTKVLSSVTAWPGGFVATGDDGTIITSPDGLTWSARSVSTTNWLYRVRYLNGFLIALGENGVLLTSTNATNWTSRSTLTSKWLNDVTYLDGTYFVVGTSGTVLTSSNLVNWANVGTLTKKALYGAATDSKQLITVGVEGAILRSQVVPHLTPVSILDYDRVLTTNLAQNVFLFAGKPDQRFTLNHATGLLSTNWTIGPALEIFDGEGILYFVETIYGTNPPPQEYYRTTLQP